MRTTRLRYLAVLGALALFATACASDDGDAGDTETAAESATSEASSEMSEMESEMTASESEGSGATAGTNTGDGTFTVGTLLPETGSLAFLGPPEFAGAELAVQDINEAGGVLGTDVELIQGDSGDTSTDIANQTTDRLLSQNADLIVGAASSAVSFTVIDKITGAGVVQFSPANTSPDFTDYEDNGLYFRTAPSDVLQGRILGQLMLQDGAQTVGIMALQDAYGEGLAQNVTESVESSGGEVVETIIYDPQAQNFDAEVQQMASADPDAIAVIGFNETAIIIPAMVEAGIGPDNKAIYGTDGNMGNALAEDIGEPSVLAGMRGTLPGSVVEEGSPFREALLEIDPDLQDYSYAGETYDAVVVSALAVQIAETDEPTVWAEEVPGVTKDGTACTEYAECSDLVEQGEDIDYDGRSGPIEMNEQGDPTVANFQILEFGPEGNLDVAETQEASLEGQ